MHKLQVCYVYKSRSSVSNVISDMQTFDRTHNFSTRDTERLALPGYNLSASQNIVFHGSKLYSSLLVSIKSCSLLFFYLKLLFLYLSHDF